MSTGKQRVNWTEAQAWADLVAAFYERHGRDPDEMESRQMVDAAREIVRNGQVLH